MLNRGDRVKFIGRDRTYEGKTGTVTHLNGDAPDDEAPDGWGDEEDEDEDVWITWDDFRLRACWVDLEDLEVV